MRYVLFVCNHNAGRSQMAQAFFNKHAPDDVRAESAGSTPVDRPWPEVVAVMQEVGIDLSHNRPKKLDLEMQLHADWAVTLGCGGVCPYVPSRVEEWELQDPKGKPLDEVRAIRDDIERRVLDLIERSIDEIRTDRTAHRLRLGRILPSLVDEFEDRRPAEEIKACTEAVLEKYTDADVRSFVMTLAIREARECLKGEGCSLLATA
jgi:protein-tyrosine-phosphatase